MSNGYAAAARPVTSSAITTPDAGLIAGDISIMDGDFPIPAYRAMPEAPGKYPVVVVIMEIFGLHEYIKDICRRLAHLGYVGIAPDIYARKGDTSLLTDFDDIRKIVYGVPDAQIMADIDSTLNWAVRESRADPNRAGITGFCWGGRITWLYAAYSDRVKAAVAWYGRLDGDHTAKQSQWPVDIAASIKCPVLGLYGGDDPAIPLDLVGHMTGELTKTDMRSQIVVYPNGPHGFHADYRPNYRSNLAKDGWKKLLDWFEDHGVK
jgi:carboxymethylenebutenolidase